MFLGEFEHSLDAKGRVILPARFRERLEAGAYISKQIDGCLAVWPPEEFERVMDEMQEKARRGPTERNAVRAFAAGAADVVPDRQGRIAIPPKLREFAGLDRDVVILGVGSRIEIWDARRWEGVQGEADQSFASAQAALADLGI